MGNDSPRGDPARAVEHRHCFQWNGDFWMQCECGHYPSEAEIESIEKRTLGD